jgi:hypothetical protein
MVPGPISSSTRCSPSSFNIENGLIPKPFFAQGRPLGVASCPTPPTSVAIATIVIGCKPIESANGISVSDITITATLNIAGDSAGMKKWPREFSMPISTAATATKVRNGKTRRVR